MVARAASSGAEAPARRHRLRISLAVSATGAPRHISGGVEEDRTPDLVIANDALSRLSYDPTLPVTGMSGASGRVRTAGFLDVNEALYR